MKKDDNNFRLLPEKQQEKLFAAWDELDRDEGLHDYDASAELSRLSSRMEVLARDSISRHANPKLKNTVELFSFWQKVASYFTQPIRALAFSFFLGAISVGVVSFVLDTSSGVVNKTDQIATSDNTTERFRSNQNVLEAPSNVTQDQSRVSNVDAQVKGEKSTDTAIFVNGDGLGLSRSSPPWRQVSDLLDNAGISYGIYRDNKYSITTTTIRFNLNLGEEKSRVLSVLLALPPTYSGPVKVVFTKD